MLLNQTYVCQRTHIGQTALKESVNYPLTVALEEAIDPEDPKKVGGGHEGFSHKIDIKLTSTSGLNSCKFSVFDSQTPPSDLK